MNNNLDCSKQGTYNSKVNSHRTYESQVSNLNSQKSNLRVVGKRFNAFKAIIKHNLCCINFCTLINYY